MTADVATEVLPTLRQVVLHVSRPLPVMDSKLPPVKGI